MTEAATAEMAGRNCPYCRFPIKEGGGIHECANCRAVHHEDCWVDNGGCAITSCIGGPSAQPTAAMPPAEAGPEVTLRGSTGSMPPSAPAPPAHVTTPMPPGLQGHPAPPPPKAPQPEGPTYDALPPSYPAASSGRRLPNLWLVFGFVLLLAAIGGATAVLVTKNQTSSGKRVSQTGNAPNSSGSSPAPGSNTGDTNTAPSAPNDGGLAGMSQAEIQRQSQDVIRAHQMALSVGDYRKAWKLLSPRKRRQDTMETGYSGWLVNQQGTHAGTSAGGLSVQLRSVDRTNGEATVYVSGYYDKQGCDFSGITWTHYESGRWWYDPGYSTTPARRAKWYDLRSGDSPAAVAKWHDRYRRLMGGKCAIPPRPAP